MNAIRQYSGLPKPIYLLSLARMITAMGMFIYPFLSLLLNTRLGYNEFQIGKVMLYIAAANIMGTLLAGKLADRFGRKKIYLFALTGCVVSLFFGGVVCEEFWVVPVVVVVYFFVSMTMPVLAAMITDLSNVNNRRECFSLLYLSTNIGISMGPLIAGMLFYNHTPWIFWGQGISCFLTALLVFFFISDTMPIAEASCINTEKTESETISNLGEEKRREADRSLFLLLLERPILFCFILCLAVLTFCYIEIDFILPLQVKDIFGVEVGARYFGIMSACNGIVVVTVSPILVFLTKKKEPLLNMFIAALLYAAGFGFYAFTQSIVLYVILVAVWTSGEILISTCSGEYIASHSPESHRARFQSLYEFARGIGKAFGPLAFGLFLLEHSMESAWILIAFLCILMAFALFILYRAEENRKRSKKNRKYFI
ncbi:MFS transporter [Sinanaerobacter sp. ZZT-01]|uniref:MFS transporter n=1 Tax=Sinanaerobacter sp. ZZT-01 TaxID=3111540 RepID=UPI002D7A3153|nr:MFS transporter [Sinanaerobacter sp. ZZT-01]WRR95038.1 MFS transporter [Sinanaerobacter sp. ZZT-01]